MLHDEIEKTISTLVIIAGPLNFWPIIIMFLQWSAINMALSVHVFTDAFIRIVNNNIIIMHCYPVKSLISLYRVYD